MNREQCLSLINGRDRYKEETVDEHKCGICKSYFDRPVREYQTRYIANIRLCMDCRCNYNEFVLEHPAWEEVVNLENQIDLVKKALNDPLDTRSALLKGMSSAMVKAENRLQKAVDHYVRTSGGETDHNKLDII